MKLGIICAILPIGILLQSCGKAAEPVEIKVKIENDLLVWDETASGPITQSISMVGRPHNVAISKDGDAIEFEQVGGESFTTDAIFANGYLDSFRISTQNRALSYEEARGVTDYLYKKVISWGFTDAQSSKPLLFQTGNKISQRTGDLFTYNMVAASNPTPAWEALLNDPRKPAVAGMAELRTKNIVFGLGVIDLYRYQDRESEDGKRYSVEATFALAQDNEVLKKARIEGPARNDLGDRNWVSAINKPASTQ